MTCNELQRVLPFIIESGGTAEERAHLSECAVCGDLVADLSYIATHAKLLLPMEEDPDPRVWESIQNQLKTEGLIPGDSGSDKESSKKNHSDLPR